MDKRSIGNLEVSAVGLGCMGLSHAYGAPTEKKEAVNLIRSAYEEAGYTFFDTAESYVGENTDGSISYNEELVGKALKDVRSSVVIATKFGVRHSPDGLLTDSRAETIRVSVENSLKRLGTDYIDLYYQHRIDEKVPAEEVAGVMSELISEGKVLHWGISEADENYIRKADAVCHVTAIQNRLSMMARWHEALFPVLEELKIGFVAFSPMANGFLTGKYGKGGNYGKDDYRSTMPQFSDEGIEKNRELLSMIGRIAKEKKATEAQISMAWMLCKKPYIVPIPGSRKLSRIKENAGAANILLSKEEVDALDQALSEMEMSEVFGGNNIVK